MAVRIPGVGTPINFGEVELKSEDWNDSHKFHISYATESFKSTIKSTIRQAIDRSTVFSGDGDDVFVEAYTSAGGRNSTVNISQSNALFDTNKYRVFDSSSESPLFVIRGTVSDISQLNGVNGCFAAEIEPGVVLVRATGTFEEARAKIINTLFWSNSASTFTPRILSAFSSVTSIETSVSRDVGKRAYFVKCDRNADGEGTFTGTFNDTSDNHNISSWWNLQITSSGTSSTPNTFSANTVSSEKDNQTDSQLRLNTQTNNANQRCSWRIPQGTELGHRRGTSSGTPTATGSALVLCKSSMTWVASGVTILEETDFFVDESIPLMVSLSENYTFIITHDLPAVFEKPMVSSIGSVIYTDFETGSSVQYKLVNTSTPSETGWLEMNEISTFAEITPDQVVVKLIPKSSSPTAGYPSIRGFGFYGGNDDE